MENHYLVSFTTRSGEFHATNVALPVADCHINNIVKVIETRFGALDKITSQSFLFAL